MTSKRSADWNPLADELTRDPLSAYDELRRRCPVAYSELLGWSVFRHADVLRVVREHETFSNVVSKHAAVPNGMDPPEHTAYRRALEPFFDDEHMRNYEPVCRGIASALAAQLPVQQTCDLIAAFAVPFAARCQCAFLGWPAAAAVTLADWTARSRGARGKEDAAAAAAELRAFIDTQLQARRSGRHDDVTASLMRAQVHDRPLDDDELASILRNWTAGEVGSLAASVGILAHRLATSPALQESLRAGPAQLPAAIDELLRIEGPLILNRRVATRDVELGGTRIAAGERVAVMWIAANRDEQAFERPLEARLDRSGASNLLFGAGIHVCPGAPLARLELRVALEQLLARFTAIELASDSAPERAIHPAAGWRSLPVRLS